MTIYLYHKRHKVTGLNYFGKTKGTDPFNYLGSGVYWRKHLNKHGEDIETLQVWSFYDQESCTKFATEFSTKNNIVESKEWANLCIEDGIGGGDLLSQMSEERYQEICKNRSKKTKKSWNKRDKKTHANIQSQIWKSRPKNIKNEIYKKISDTLKNKPLAERQSTLQKRRKTLSKRTPESILQEKERRKITLSKRPTLTCPHCSKQSKSRVNMRRYHFDECRFREVKT